MTSGDFASLDRVALEKIHGANTDAYIGRLRESFLSLGNEHLWTQVDIEAVEKCLLNQHPDFYELPLKQIALCLNKKFFTYSTEKIYSVNDSSINTLTSCLQLVESKQLCSMEPWRFHFFLKMPLEKRQIIANSLNHRTLLHLQKPILCDILQRLSPELLELTCDVFGDLLLEREEAFWKKLCGLSGRAYKKVVTSIPSHELISLRTEILEKLALFSDAKVDCLCENLSSGAFNYASAFELAIEANNALDEEKFRLALPFLLKTRSFCDSWEMKDYVSLLGRIPSKKIELIVGKLNPKTTYANLIEEFTFDKKKFYESLLQKYNANTLAHISNNFCLLGDQNLDFVLEAIERSNISCEVGLKDVEQIVTEFTHSQLKALLNEYGTEAIFTMGIDLLKKVSSGRLTDPSPLYAQKPELQAALEVYDAQKSKLLRAYLYIEDFSEANPAALAAFLSMDLCVQAIFYAKHQERKPEPAFLLELKMRAVVSIENPRIEIKNFLKFDSDAFKTFKTLAPEKAIQFLNNWEFDPKTPPWAYSTIDFSQFLDKDQMSNDLCLISMLFAWTEDLSFLQSSSPFFKGLFERQTIQPYQDCLAALNLENMDSIILHHFTTPMMDNLSLLNRRKKELLINYDSERYARPQSTSNCDEETDPEYLQKLGDYTKANLKILEDHDSMHALSKASDLEVGRLLEVFTNAELADMGAQALNLALSMTKQQFDFLIKKCSKASCFSPNSDVILKFFANSSIEKLERLHAILGDSLVKLSPGALSALEVVDEAVLFWLMDTLVKIPSVQSIKQSEEDYCAFWDKSLNKIAAMDNCTIAKIISALDQLHLAAQVHQIEDIITANTNTI